MKSRQLVSNSLFWQTDVCDLIKWYEVKTIGIKEFERIYCVSLVDIIVVVCLDFLFMKLS
jgi:hypothetical protein